MRKFDRRFDSDTPLDDFINFKDEAKITGPSRTFPITRTIVFRIPPGALETFRSGVHSNLRAGAAPFVPKHLMDNVDEDAEEDEAAVDEELDLHEPEGSDESVTVENSFKPLAPPTEDELRAASRIQRGYRNWHSRQNGNYTAKEAALQFWYKSCLAISAGMRRTYRLYFLGPLPHALLSLQNMNERAHSMKKAARKSMLKASASELEEADERFSRAK